jgi:ATP-dependent helicase/nuclease subunit A
MMASAESRNLLVMASAGTGKTFQLTGRYLDLAMKVLSAPGAESGADLSTILATTFTRKAAGEILDRVLERLSLAAIDEGKRHELSRQLGRALTATECETALFRILKDLHRLTVLTIDSFFMRIASVYSLELGVPPGWSITDDETDAQLRSDALDRMMEEMGKEAMLRGLEQMSPSGAFSARGCLEKPLKVALLAVCASGFDPQPWQAIEARTRPLDKAELNRVIDGIRNLQAPLTKTGSPRKSFVTAHENAVEHLLAGKFKDFIVKGIASKMLDAECDEITFDRVPVPPETLDAYGPVIDHAAAVLVDQLRAKNLATFQFALAFHKAYHAAKRSRGLYRFDDVPQMLLNATEQGRLDDLYFRLDARISHVLLDEFQDTSIDQFRLLEPILDEQLSSEDERTCFCVGDVKQSIYGWRGAEPALMPSLASRWPGRFRQIPLDESYRSSQAITDTVNEIFLPLAANPVIAERSHVAQAWLTEAKPHKTAKKLSGCVTLWECGVDDEGKPSPHTFAARRVKAIHDVAPTATIAVLVRAKKHIPKLMFELSKLGILASEEAGSPLEDAPAVSAILSLLHLADFPDDTAAAFHVASGPLGPFLELDVDGTPRRRSQVASFIRGRLMRDGYGPTLRWLRAELSSTMDARGLMRLDQLIEVANAFDEQAGTRPSEFVKIARSKRIEDPSSSRVRVMTIHKSKGLEFDAVILPDLNAPWDKFKNLIVLRDSPMEPIRLISHAADKAVQACHEELAAGYSAMVDRNVSEQISALYVAVTRAKHCLEMIVPPLTEKESKDDTGPALTGANVLRAALAPGAVADAEGLLWRKTHGDDWTRELTRPATNETTTEVGFRFKPGSHSLIPRPPRASPSSLKKTTRNLADIFSPRGEAAASTGTLLHEWYALIEWLDDGEPAEEALDAAASKLGWSPRDAAAHVPTFRRSLSGQGGGVLRRAHHATLPPIDAIEVRREWAFEVPILDDRDERVLLNGRFDRLVLGRRNGAVVWAEVIDFKSDRVGAADAAALRSRVDSYRPQMRGYAKAVSALFGLTSDQVMTTLLFVQEGISVPVRDDPNG